MDYILAILHKMLLNLAINHRLTSQEIIWIWGSGFDIDTIAGRLDASNPYFAPVVQVCDIYKSVVSGSLSVSDGGNQALAISQKPVVVPSTVTTSSISTVTTSTDTASTETSASTSTTSDTSTASTASTETSAATSSDSSSTDVKTGE